MSRRISRAALGLSSLALLALRSADLPPQYFPVMGGSGGTTFTRDCGAGRVLTGFRYRASLVVDAIGISCRPVLGDGTLGPESTVGTLVGGSGGTSGAASCPAGSVLAGVWIGYGSYVSRVRAYCSAWRGASRSFVLPPNGTAFDVGTLLTPISGQKSEMCEAAVQPASSIRGRAAAFVDAVGLVCDEP